MHDGSRREILLGGVALSMAVAAGWLERAAAAPLPEVVVYQSPT